MATTFSLTYSAFVNDYTEFADTAEHPQTVVERYISHCVQLIKPGFWGDDVGPLALRSAVAHCLKMWERTKRTDAVGAHTTVSVDAAITEGWSPPPNIDEDRYWNTTSFGLEVIRLKKTRKVRRLPMVAGMRRRRRG